MTKTNNIDWKSKGFFKFLPEEKHKYAANVLNFMFDHMLENYGEHGHSYIFACVLRIMTEYILIKSEVLDIIDELMSDEFRRQASNPDLFGIDAEATFIRAYCENKVKQLKNIK